MAMQLKTVEINGHSYEIGQMNATRSIELMYDLSKWTSGAFGKLGNGVLKSARGSASMLDSDVGEMDFAGAFQAFFENCPKDQFVKTLKELCITNVTRNGKKVNFDTDFQGNQGEAFQLAVEVLKYNFAGFISAVSGALSPMKNLISQRLTPAPSTGLSGDQSLQM